jgi:hypothetical protein
MFVATDMDFATMFELFNRRSVLFYIARCHGELTWYLSMDTLARAANDNGISYIGTGLPDKPYRFLRLLTSPAE